MRTPRNHYKTIRVRYGWAKLQSGDEPARSKATSGVPRATRCITTYRYLFDRTKEFHRCPRTGQSNAAIKDPKILI